MDSTSDPSRRGWLRLRRSRPALAWVPTPGGRLLTKRKVLPSVYRLSTYAAVAGFAFLAVTAAPLIELANPTGGTYEVTPVAAAAGDVETLALSRRTSSRGGSGFLVRAAQPHTNLSETAAPPDLQAVPTATPRAVQTYVVQPGDTVIDLAERFGITPDTILSANSELAGNPDLLRLGQELTILPVSGVLHEVQAGETLASIAEAYDIDAGAIVAYPDNHLSEPYALQVGQKLMLPGAELPAPPAPRYAAAGASNGRSTIPATGMFMWPTTGRLTQYAWWGHTALDLGAQTGTPIYAADAGYVSEAGWTNVGYGLYVVLDHGNGFRTLYGHMSAVAVEAGQSVEKGAVIGYVGSTGNSTGPHLHFEIYANGVLQNPLNYLP